MSTWHQCCYALPSCTVFTGETMWRADAALFAGVYWTCSLTSMAGIMQHSHSVPISISFATMHCIQWLVLFRLWELLLHIELDSDVM